MRICILSSFSGKYDEGMGNIAAHIAEELAKTNSVLHLSIERKSPLCKSFWANILKFQPDIIQYIPGPSIISFILLRMLKLCGKAIKTVALVTQPRFSLFSCHLIRTLRPDLVICQSSETRTFFIKNGCRTKLLSIGVDIDKFVPVPKEKKIAIRNKYKIPQEKFIILHIGPIKKARNIEILANLNVNDNQVIIVGSTTSGIDARTKTVLEHDGCLVFTQYMENIELIYGIADCYVFPTRDKYNCIEMPLTVMESMSCNLPVISTKYGALPSHFAPGDGLYYVETDKDYGYLIEEIKGIAFVNTRAKVLTYSWANVVSKLNIVYSAVTA